MSPTEQGPNRFVRVVLKTFGFVHIAIALDGLWVVVPHLLTRDPSVHPIDPMRPYAEPAFLVMSAINILFLLVEVTAGIYLLRLPRTGIFISNILFISLILYFLGGRVVFISGNGPVSDSIAAAAGAGNMGVIFQLIIGYPLIALIGLNLVGRKLRRKPAVAPA